MQSFFAKPIRNDNYYHIEKQVVFALCFTGETDAL